MGLLLDTVAFLWFVTGDDRLSTSAAEAISGPGHDVFLSSVSSWEIALKHGLGKLPLPEDPSTLIPRLRTDHGIAELQLGEAAALTLSRLPHVHRDPFDRMLVCQAIAHGLTIVTPDPEIRKYPTLTVW